MAYKHQAIIIIRAAKGFVAIPMEAAPIGLDITTGIAANELGYTTDHNSILRQAHDLLKLKDEDLIEPGED